MIDAIPAGERFLSKEAVGFILNRSTKSCVQLRSKDSNVMLYDISEIYKLSPRLPATHSIIPSGRTTQGYESNCTTHLLGIYPVRVPDLSLTFATTVLSLHRNHSVMVTQRCVQKVMDHL